MSATQTVEQTPGAAASLSVDLRSLQDMANRRGGAWLIKWAGLFDGVYPNYLAKAEETGDRAYAAYIMGFPNDPDTRR